MISCLIYQYCIKKINSKYFLLLATNEKSIIQTSNQQYEINIGHERQKILWPQQQKHQMPFFSFYATY